MRGATLVRALGVDPREISIHAPHAGCDRLYRWERHNAYISIHAPHAGCDVLLADVLVLLAEFQSTHPMRGATRTETTFSTSTAFQSTHPMRGATRRAARDATRPTFQSTHPMRGATRKQVMRTRCNPFQSTHPMRGATVLLCKFLLDKQNFNPRTPCGVRRHHRREGQQRQHFNPRTPCGVRRGRVRREPCPCGFQSTHPMRGATLYLVPIRGSHRQQRADSLKNKYYQFKTNNYAF